TFRLKMLKLFVVLAVLLPILSSAPSKPLPAAFCKMCPKVVDQLLDGPGFINRDKNATQAICDKVLGADNIMSNVCVAGLLGEIEYLHTIFQGHSEEICEKLGCPPKK
ncbi:hypothetical protein PFISCL1PPCAC_21830, partial [Pristionchus fissidentatus]